MAELNRIVILASGRGSNFCALADAVKNKIIPNAVIAGLVCNKANAPVLKEAEFRGIPQHLLPSKTFLSKDGKFDRVFYEDALIEVIANLKPHWILLAGYMLILGPKVIHTFVGKIINIHPSLLPHFKGLRPLQQALDAKMKRVGCSVHWVTEELDGGAVLEQSALVVLESDTEATLAARLLPLEHDTYVRALKKLCL